MSWLDTVTALLSNPATSAAGTAILNHTLSNQTMVAQVMNQIQLMQANPANAATIASNIGNITGVPAQVLPLINNLAALAVGQDPASRAAFATQVAQIQSILLQSHWF